MKGGNIKKPIGATHTRMLSISLEQNQLYMIQNRAGLTAEFRVF